MKKKTLFIPCVVLCAVFLVGILSGLWLDAQGNGDTRSSDPFEQAVGIIKKYETLHQPRHWPLVGYGHKVLPGEKFNRRKTMTEADADALLRKDLRKNCAMFRKYGPDSLLLGVLAYNIGAGAVGRSSIVKKLDVGDRDIRDVYISHCRYKGKVHNQIRNRRIEEFNTLFIKDIALTPAPVVVPYKKPAA